MESSPRKWQRIGVSLAFWGCTLTHLAKVDPMDRSTFAPHVPPWPSWTRELFLRLLCVCVESLFLPRKMGGGGVEGPLKSTLRLVIDAWSTGSWRITMCPSVSEQHAVEKAFFVGLIGCIYGDIHPWMLKSSSIFNNSFRPKNPAFLH